MDQEYLCDRLCDSLDAITMELQEVNRNLQDIDKSLDSIKVWIKNDVESK
jgi:hypothetical protein